MEHLIGTIVMAWQRNRKPMMGSIRKIVKSQTDETLYMIEWPDGSHSNTRYPFNRVVDFITNHSELRRFNYNVNLYVKTIEESRKD